MKPDVLLIRADASLVIGTGHVMRCLALAQAWIDTGGSVHLLVAELPQALLPRMTAEGVAVSRIAADATPGGIEDANQTLENAHRLRADWVVIDGDRFGTDFLQTVWAAGFRVLLIDDFADRETFSADLIVNPNPNPNQNTDDNDDGNHDPDEARVYRKRGATASLLLGPRYVLLRREFRKEREERASRLTGNRILVTLGGSDPENLTPKIANALAKRPDLEITVIAGPGYNGEAELRALQGANLRILFNPPNIAELMKKSDQAIVAAGGTLWELLSVGCAVLIYSRNIVQKQVVQGLAKRGVVVDMGETRHLDMTRLTTSVSELSASPDARDRMAKLGRILVDGMGATRIVEAMHRFGAGAVGMQAIAIADREEFERMAIKHFSELNPGFTPRSDWQEQYFQTIISDPQLFLRWIICDDTRAGFILFGLEKHRFLPRRTGVISELYVRPEFRRRGVARACAADAIRELWTHAPSKIRLEVMEGNTAAVAFWQSVGFQKVTDCLVLNKDAL